MAKLDNIRIGGMIRHQIDIRTKYGFGEVQKFNFIGALGMATNQLLSWIEEVPPTKSVEIKIIVKIRNWERMN